MMKIPVKRGDIVDVDLDGAVGAEKQNDKTSRGRPCVVIQNDKGNDASDLTIIVPLTDPAQHKPHLKIQVLVSAAELGFPNSKDSVIECGHVRSIDGDRRIRAHLGRLSYEAMRRLDEALAISVGLWRPD